MNEIKNTWTWIFIILIFTWFIVIFFFKDNIIVMSIIFIIFTISAIASHYENKYNEKIKEKT